MSRVMQHALLLLPCWRAVLDLKQPMICLPCHYCRNRLAFIAESMLIKTQSQWQLSLAARSGMIPSCKSLCQCFAVNVSAHGAKMASLLELDAFEISGQIGLQSTFAISRR